MAVGCPGESVPETRNQGFQIGGVCWLVHGAFPTCFLCRLPTPPHTHTEGMSARLAERGTHRSFLSTVLAMC